MKTKQNILLFLMAFVATILPTLVWADTGEMAGAVGRNFMDFFVHMINPAKAWMWPIIIIGIVFSLYNKWVRENICAKLGGLSIAWFIYNWQEDWIWYIVGFYVGRYILFKFPFLKTMWGVFATAIGGLFRLRELWGWFAGIPGTALFFAMLGSESLTSYEYEGWPLGMIPLFVAFAGGCLAFMTAIGKKKEKNKNKKLKKKKCKNCGHKNDPGDRICAKCHEPFADADWNCRSCKTKNISYKKTACPQCTKPRKPKEEHTTTCPHCQEPNAQGYKFCGKCGKSPTDSQAQPQQATATTAQSQATPITPPINQATSQTTQTSSSKSDDTFNIIFGGFDDR